MILRPSYIDVLKSFIDKPQIKILTGIRRSGKSTVLQLLRQELLELGVNEQQIIAINLESFAYADLLDTKQLYRFIEEQLTPGQRSYLLLDEIQELVNWEKLVNSLQVDFDVDLYITGSNSHLLSSELATYLAGRYVEIPIYTLSFREFLDFRKHYHLDESTHSDLFLTYLRQGGFPVIHTVSYSEEAADRVIYDIYSSVILRDTLQRYKIRDVELLERVVKYALDNIGNTFSGKNVADYFKSQQRKIDINTVYNYLHALEGAFILHRVPRYDLKGKEILKTQEKFYVSDVSIVYATLGIRDRMIAGVLENIVFLELRRRGYQVFVGKYGTTEIDFVAEKNNQRIYVQVAYRMENEQTIQREFGNLLAIPDQYPKYVVTMDPFWKDTINGVRHLYISDFLLNESL
jgi:predicted AAA+ superfamily ATPase